MYLHAIKENELLCVYLMLVNVLFLTCCSAGSNQQGHIQVTCQSSGCFEFNIHIEHIQHTAFDYTGNGLERNYSICGGELDWTLGISWNMSCAVGEFAYNI